MTGTAGKTALIKKMRLNSEMRALVVNAPEGFWNALGKTGSEMTFLAGFEDQLDFVLVFAHYQAEITELMPQVQQSLVEDGLLWLAYPKKSSKVESDLSRDVFWDLISDYGYRPVTQISIDDVWSGLRFRPAHLVGK